jgi:hypothetical protein
MAKNKSDPYKFFKICIIIFFLLLIFFHIYNYFFKKKLIEGNSPPTSVAKLASTICSKFLQYYCFMYSQDKETNSGGFTKYISDLEKNGKVYPSFCSYKAKNLNEDGDCPLNGSLKGTSTKDPNPPLCGGDSDKNFSIMTALNLFHDNTKTMMVANPKLKKDNPYPPPGKCSDADSMQPNVDNLTTWLNKLLFPNK